MYSVHILNAGGKYSTAMKVVGWTEEVIVKVLLDGPSSFGQIVAGLTDRRKLLKREPGSRSTISLALKSLYAKKFVDHDPESHKWHVTSLGRWIVGEGLVPTKSALALSKVTEPLLSAVQDNPQKLSELLSIMFVYSFARRRTNDEFSEQEEMILKQTETKLTLFINEYPAAIEAIWGDGAELMVGAFSSLMAGILLHRLSLAQDYRTQTSLVETIPKIVDQYFKSLSAELGKFLIKSLADLNKLATLDRKVKANR
ncbi:MAG: hypothetical protein ABSA92_14355 [Candidatus Bathyarchaeia archaeon]|jgi:hypothetical protein